MSAELPARRREDVSERDAAQLSAYLDGELDAQDRAALETRLTREPPLREELEALRHAGRLLLHLAELDDGARGSAAGAAQAPAGQTQPSELPVAQAVTPPRLRRALLVALGLLLVAGLAVLAVRFAQRLGLATPTGWRLTPSSGQVAIQRGGRISMALEPEWLLAGDRVHLDAQETALITEFHGLTLKVLGPAVVGFDARGGVFLEEGRLSVSGSGSSAARALRLRTPDGEVAAGPGKEFAFEVQARRKPPPLR